MRRFASLAPVVCALAFIIVAAGCGDVSRDARAGSITPIVARDSTWAPPNPPATTLPRLEDLQPDLAAAANAYQVPGVVPPTADAGAALSTGAAPAPPPVPVARSMLAELPIYAGSADASPARRLGNPTEFGSPLTLLVLGSEGPSLQVVLPVRPNGAVGWVRASDVELTSIDDRIDIDLTARMLTWTRAGAPLMQHAVAVGAPSSPTPVGLFFVTDVVREDAAGQYGPWAVALSAYSDTFRSSSGDYRIAIHGTNRPDSIGKAVSQGCARLPNDVVTTLAAGVPLGTPVTIH